MMHSMFRKTVCTASRKTVSTLVSMEALQLRTCQLTDAVGTRSDACYDRGSLISGCRDFRTESSRIGLRFLCFKATPYAQAEFAVADYFDEEKAKVSDEGLEISGLGISQEIVSALAKKGITKLFPIQKAVLDPAMQGRDMIGRARTGTGKTLAFGIPILDKIIQFNAKHGKGRNPLALVLAPTRELAKQVDKEFYESAPNLESLCVYGGTPISRQMNQLDYGVDVVVGTPGRIIDLLKRGALNLSEIRFVVLDEADQMLNVGFEEDVEVILSKLPQKRQSMMFSATMPTWIRELSMKYLKNPLTVDLVGDSVQKLADGISLYSVVSDMYGKASIIGPLITEHAKGGKCIVFTQTKREADRLSCAMQRKFKCEALHGDISQNQRERTLSGFRSGSFNILVATDVAARGLDIPNVDLIIHYELPNTSEIFVHRSGRTGRAGKKGSAIVIYTDDQFRAVKNIEREVGCRFIELPRIAADAADRDMLGDFGGGGGGFRRSGGGSSRYSDSGFGRSGSFGGSGRFGSFGRVGGQSSGGFSRQPGSSRPSNSDDAGFGRRGDFGGFSRQSGGVFGGSNQGSGRSTNSDGAGFGRRGSFGDFGSLNSSGGLGGFGSGRTSRFGSFGDSK